MKLVGRFESFMRSMPGCENIDDLLRGVEEMNGIPLKRRQRADYLFSGRTVVVEQKSLIIDPVDKPQKFVNKLAQERRFILFGRHSTDPIFAGQPDPQRLQYRMLRSITKGLEDGVAEADGQASDTRVIFKIPNALSLLVILNESAPTLRPDVIDWGLREVLRKTNAAGSARYPNNDGVLVISEAHTWLTPHGRSAPCFGGPTGSCRSPDRVTALLESLARDWARYNELPLDKLASFPAA